MRNAVLLALLSGCTSQPAQQTQDLSTPDLSDHLCMVTTTGDETGAEPCEQNSCRESTSDQIQVYDILGHTTFNLFVVGQIMPGRTYHAADLASFSASAVYLTGNERRYDWDTTTVPTITITDVTPSNSLCPGNLTAHGSTHVQLVQTDPQSDGGNSNPKHITVDFEF
jgi:hypothetical protein